MSYAAFKIKHLPTGIETCASGNITHISADLSVQIPPIQSDDSEWTHSSVVKKSSTPLPNLVVTAGNVLEVYDVRVKEEDEKSSGGAETRGGPVMDEITGACLELVCHYRLHGNVESMAILSTSGDGHRRRDSIVLAFKDSKISILEYDDSVCGLRTSSMHCFEGPEWNYLKRGHESFAHGPEVKTDSQGRCAAVLVYDLQMIILNASQYGQVFVSDDETTSRRGSFASCIESSYIINLRELDMKHIKDFIFVHGYIEPVMVILHELELTWAGRTSWKHHTCMISAHSISMTLKQHPLIWSASNLPHDAYKLFAVPSPIGGVLVICANSIHYHSQNSSCVLGVNNFFASGDDSSNTPRTNFSVELDAANATWLAHDILMFSAKNGVILLLTLVYDGRMVNKLELSMAKISVLTSGITTIGDKFFFLASRLGDSILVQYNCGTSSSNSSHEKDEDANKEDDVPPAKRLCTPSFDALEDISSIDELSLYSSINNSLVSTEKNFSFLVRDSLVNIGPLRDFSYGLRINADPNATGIAKQSNYEMVCCSGHGKNGSLCILQQSIRPELITEVELAGCKGIWTVYHKSGRNHVTDSKLSAADDEYHAYLIISLESRTMVLETADLLGEVTESVDYYVQGSTIAAGNLFGRRRVVQVFKNGARILDGSYMTQEIFLGEFSSDNSSNSDNLNVVSASIADPYVLVKISDGSIQLLVGDPSTCTVSVNIPVLSGNLIERISACTLYHDKGPDPWLRKTSTDAWLSTGVSDIDSSDGAFNDQGDIYCLVCYEGGTLEFFEVSSFKCVFSVKNFMSGKKHLVDSYVYESSIDSEKEKDGSQVKTESGQNLKILEVAMHKWSGQHSRPFLFVLLNDGTMFCYHAFLYETQDNMSKIDESLSSQNCVDRSTSRLRNLKFVRISLNGYIQDYSTSTTLHPRFTIFENIRGYHGIFVAGLRPTWFMVCRERLRIHPQLCDGSVLAFTVLHNVNCNHGLIYVTSQGFMKICQLPSAVNYDNYWPLQKIPLRATPHQITYFAERNLYPVIVSFSVEKPINQIISSLTDQETNHQPEHDKSSSDSFQKYATDEFEIRILEPEKSGNSWETKATIPMQTSENALTIRMVSLLNSESKENETLLAIGTAYTQGEDIAGRGRVMLFSFRKKLENSQNLVSEVYSKELKGAISALSSLQGHLLVASGPKITLFKWTGTELNGVAFFDAPPLHAVSMNIVKNFILLGDIHKSIYFLNWKEQGAQLTLLAKDFGSLDCYATEFLIDGSTLSLVVSDDQKNVQIFYYAPKMSESWKGQKLLTRAEFHAGAHVTKFMRLQMLSVSPDKTNPISGSEKTNRFALLFGTLDGSIGCVAPLDEITFRRLQTLQRKMVEAIPHVCGLNPRAFRQFRSCGKPHRPGPDNIVDFELLSHYEMLTLDEQLEIAQQTGTTRPQILSNLNDFSVGTSFL